MLDACPARSFAEQEGAAFVAAVCNKPKGFLAYTTVANASWSWGNIGYIASGSAGAFPGTNPSDVLVDLIYAVKAGYRQNGVFVMNRKTQSVIRKFKDTGGAYLWAPPAQANPYYQPGGHHEMPKGVYEKWELSRETREVFDKATTGKVPTLVLRTTPDGVPQGYFWSGPRGAHFDYNEAVKGLSNRFLETNNIRPENMTPDQARALLKEIRESQDPRIRDYNATIRRLRRLFPLRGRGTE